MNTLRLCYLARADSLHTRRWVGYFQEKGHEVLVIHIGDGPARRPWREVKLHDLPAGFNIPKIRYLVWYQRARSIIGHFKPDILHAHQVSRAGWIGSGLRFHPYVVTPWGSDLLIHAERSMMARLLAGHVLRQADLVISPSSPLYHSAVKMSGSRKKIHLMNWGIDCDTFTPSGDTKNLRTKWNLTEDRLVVFSPRGARLIYNIDTIVEAMSYVVQKVPKVYLILVDMNKDPAYLGKIGRMIERLNLKDHLKIVPRLSYPHEMAAAFRLSDIVVSIPSSDSLSLTVLEAMASGSALVVSRLEAYDDWIEDHINGVTVPIRDAFATGNAIVELLKDRQKRIRMGEKSRALVLNHAHYGRQMEKAEKLYGSILRQSKQTS